MKCTEKVSIKDKAKAYDSICEMLCIGSSANTPNVVRHNIENLLRFADQQEAVELKHFMVEVSNDQIDQDEESDEECLLNRWGSSTEQYVAQFGAALTEIEPYKSLLAENAKLIHQRETLQSLLSTYAKNYSETNPFVVEALNFGKNDA